ncbi:pirin family protein [Paenibacillus sacheonensis]|uniref:Pirin family protein n=1 Tax=Paenibacillus sacheonensis TaxID=742054 RepID=A0A7X5C4V4_9BACL|nr:pirin family protein [Paenibacillus sacheonensis]MBM7569051.1 redox-sensitive bicupin YhaK (pirin superfamily) [Paenibacillus sacheonensis]NBC72769.1 pirin family protein [Paenibacillus sacheonensis]
MMNVYPAASRHSFDLGWLRGSHSFSFGNYFEEENTSFGPMRVLNDDTISPKRGFGAHPHSDMEILSIVLQGDLRHEDSLGNVMITNFGGVQRMSAGTGVVHTEHNPSETDDVTLLQLWFEPEQRGLTPSYETTSFDSDALSGRLLPIASSNAVEHSVAKLHQDMTVYLSKLKAGSGIAFNQQPGRRVFLFVIEGSLNVTDESDAVTLLNRRDSARIENETFLQLEGDRDTEETFFMLIDLP